MDPRVRATPPPAQVCRAWGVSEVAPLPGGQGGVYASGEIVLKPVVDEAEATWLAATLASLPPPAGFRLIRPLPARSGEWVFDGWAAWERLAGRTASGAWREALAVSLLFHGHVSHLRTKPPAGRSHPWAVGDRWAWGEEELEISGELGDVAARLLERRKPVQPSAQFVHGDLINNILFADGLPPAVIDVSPYWRPARYADAIIVVDAIGWHGTGTEAVASFVEPEDQQMLIRAALFRLASAAVNLGDHTVRLAAQVPVYERIEAALLAAQSA